MQNVVEETEYVLAVLRGTLEQVTGNPQLFAADAQQKIEKAIAYMEWVRQQVKAVKAA